MSTPRTVGSPRRHFAAVDSTNRVARDLAAAGAPHGTLVTAGEQSSGRGRQGRAWTAPAGSSLLMTLIIRDPSPLLSLTAGVAAAETVDAVRAVAGPGTPPAAGGAAAAAGTSRLAAPPRALIKWPNDVLIDGRKVAGILVEGRPQENWAVLGIGLNVAIAPEEFPPELRQRAGTLGLQQSDTEAVLSELLTQTDRWLSAPKELLLAELEARSYLRGKEVTWAGGSGTASAIDAGGGLIVTLADGTSTVLDAGEVHLGAI